MTGTCSQCTATGLAILPVRMAVLPRKFIVDKDVGEKNRNVWEDLPGVLKMPDWAHCKWTGRNLGGNAQAGLRAMRSGYLYVYYPTARKTVYGVIAKWEVYTVNESGSFSLTAAAAPKPSLTIREEQSAPCKRCGPQSGKTLGHITIVDPEDCHTAYIAFSEHAWSRNTRLHMEKEPATRMMHIQPADMLKKKGAGEQGQGWVNADITKIQSVLEYCPDVNEHIVKNFYERQKIAEEMIDQDEPGTLLHELSPWSRRAISTDPKLCGLHNPDILRSWGSIYKSLFRWADNEPDTKGYTFGNEFHIYANNSLETRRSQKNDWDVRIVQNYLDPMKLRSGDAHPGVLLALDDPLGVALELNGILGKNLMDLVQYETQRKAEIEAANAIHAFPIAWAHKQSSRQLTKDEYDERRPAAGFTKEEIPVPAEYGYNGKTGDKYVISEARTDYRIIQSPEDAWAEAKSGGPLGKKIFNVEEEGEYRARVIRKSAEPMSEREYEERKSFLAPEAQVDIEEEPIIGSPGDLSGGSQTISRYTVRQSDEAALKEAESPGPLMQKVLRDTQWAWSDFHDATDYYQNVDWERFNYFNASYKNFLKDHAEVVKDRCDALADWLQYDGLFLIFDDYDSTSKDECLQLATVMNDLLDGIDSSDGGMSLYSQWAELKIQGKKNLLVRTLCHCRADKEEDVMAVLRAAYALRDKEFVKLDQIDPMAKNVKAVPNIYRAQLGVQVHEALAGKGKGIQTPKGVQIHQQLPKMNATIFAAMETMGGGGSREITPQTRWYGRDYTLFKWIGINKRMDRLGANIIYFFLLDGTADDAAVRAEVGKNVQSELHAKAEEVIKNTRTNPAVTPTQAETWKKLGKEPADKGLVRQKELTSRGAFLAITVGLVEFGRLLYLLDYARTKKYDNWILTRQLLGCSSVVAQCSFDLAAQVERARQLNAGAELPFKTPAYCRFKFFSGLCGGISSGLAVYDDLLAVGRERLSGFRKGLLCTKAVLDFSQAIASIYVATTYSVRAAGAMEVCLGLASFGAGRIFGMIIGPWGILLTVIVEIIIWRTADDEIEKWVQQSAFSNGKHRKISWLNEPELQMEALGQAMNSTGMNPN
ncbi:T6SS effector BTH_I2691 family protein [Variovorax sp. LT1R20]|uniref:T6SS effector BTH_I2691 family protein n=1 Tax=Variovorax sp. LT1R20 TaxID=3443729 RepID=UPI003F46EC43